MKQDLKLNQRTKQQLANYLKFHRGNVILLGEKHMGKHMAALELAKRLLFQGDSAADYKNFEDCQISLEHNLDFMEIKPDDGCIKVKQIRRLLEQSRYKAVQASKKVFVIDDADTMSEAAQNALLKIMEDGAGYSIFLLVAHRPLLKTISSRSMTIPFLPLDVEEGDSVALYLASNGNPGIIEHYRDSEFIKFTTSFIQMMSNTKDRRYILKELGELREKNPGAFFIKFSEEEKECFMSVLENLFGAALHLRVGIPCMEEVSDTASHINGLYDMEEICAVLKEIMSQKRMILRHRYSKNDFFNFVIMLGGKKYVI